MGATTLAAVAGHFGRDLAFDLDRVATIVRDAREAGAGLVVFPDGTLGGFLPVGALPASGPATPMLLPEPLAADDPVFASLAALAGDTLLCVAYCERADGVRFASAVCLSGDGVLGRHRKVHQSAGETDLRAPGDGFVAFDTPVGRVGMLLSEDRAYPEAARVLALDGATVLACLAAEPTTPPGRSPAGRVDARSRLFDVIDTARAVENQVVVVSANQVGSSAGMRFLGQAKVVGPSGEILARTPGKAGLALASLDIEAVIERARAGGSLLKERHPEAYRSLC